MRFNDSHAAEPGQDSGEVRAIYVFLGLTAASALLPSAGSHVFGSGRWRSGLHLMSRALAFPRSILATSAPQACGFTDIHKPTLRFTAVARALESRAAHPHLLICVLLS